MSHCPLWDIKDQMNIIRNTFPVVFKHWHLLFSVRYFMFTVFWSMRGGVHRGIKWPRLYMLTLNWIHHFWRVGSWPIKKVQIHLQYTIFFFICRKFIHHNTSHEPFHVPAQEHLLPQNKWIPGNSSKYFVKFWAN